MLSIYLQRFSGFGSTFNVEGINWNEFYLICNGKAISQDNISVYL